MARYVTDPANENYSFGHDFNYDVWTADTQVTLTNVPWDNTYRDTVWFDTDAALNVYIDSNMTTNTVISNMSYAKISEPIKLNIPFNQAFKYNYVRVHNPAQPIPGAEGDTFYYFITSVHRSAPNTTIVTVEIDVWQSFIRQMSFGRCYIERGHVGVAASNAFDNYGRTFLTMPEGIDTGGEMVTVAHRKQTTMRALDPNATVPENLLNYDVLVVSTIDLTVDYDPDQIEIKAAQGSAAQYMESGAALYVLPALSDTSSPGDINYHTWLDSLTDVPWVAQGIVSITLIPKITRYADSSFEYDTEKPTLITQVQIRPLQYDLFTNWRDSSEILNKIPARYRHLKKFFTFPYMVIEMGTATGATIILRPEAWNQANARVMERVAYMPPNQRVAYYPRGYNSLNTTYESLYESSNPSWSGITNRNDGDDGGDYLGTFTQISGFPQVPAMNDNAALAIANTMHGTAASRSSADWAQQRAINANDQSYDNVAAQGRMNTQRLASAQDTEWESLALGQQLQNDMHTLNTASGLLSGGVGGLVGGLRGMGVGAGMAGANAVVSGAAKNYQQTHDQYALQLQQQEATRQAVWGNNTTTGIAHSNRMLANSAAKGDYADTIASIDAKIQDMQMTPPGMLGQYGGDVLNFVHDGLGVSLRWKMVDGSAVARLGEFWLRYGYNVHRFGTLPPKLACMSKFTYWKLAETYITTGGVPEFFKQAIRGILEKGVTVWSDANDIGNIDPATNTPLAGITL